ncbi:MAG TPA: ATP-binding protein [Dictyobacter sp.]|jgi:signal transduction histidine kinase|nr:ATP-binding protein [Dictyobacter sp.]
MKQVKASKQLSAAERFAALSRIGAALISEQDEGRLLHLIAQTAADLTGAQFAAFTLRPINEQGELLVPAEGNLFHLAAVIGVTQEQEEMFRHMPLGGEGLLAPIFRYKVPVRVADISMISKVDKQGRTPQAHQEARDAAFAFAHGHTSHEQLRAIGLPHRHPTIRSFLGAPLLDHDQEVRGGLLLGHPDPDQFTADDEQILLGLAAQAAVAIDNARLYQNMRMRVQELQAIFESIADGVTLVDQQEHILRENTKAQQLRTQLETHEQGSQFLEALLHAPARAALQGIIDSDMSVTITDEQQERHEYVVKASPLHQQTMPECENRTTSTITKQSPQHISGAVVVWHDVTEARRFLLERQARSETEARLSFVQRILDELPTSVYLVHGHDARLVLANKTATTVWGAIWETEQPMQVFLQKNHIHIFQIDGRPLPSDKLATLRAVQQGESVYFHQEIIRHADGVTLPVMVNAIALDTKKLPIQLPHAFSSITDPEPIALVVHQDVSALKEAEQLKDEFIGIAAHELRNPLAALHGFVRLLLTQSIQGKGNELAPWQLESLQSIDQATTRLVELTDDLLDVTRLQAGRFTLRQEATDLIALVKRVVRRFQMVTEEGEHQFVIITEADFLVVSLDAQRIEQVLTNLLNNAVKYSPQGGPIEIGIWKNQEEQGATVSIKDTGIGIPEQQQARIFSRFMRAENGQALGIPGTGLGLYLSRELVERQGGRIWFQSIEGKGSTFFLSFPLLSFAQDDDAREEYLYS